MKGAVPMTVYVQNIDGQPLMPTTRCGKVRRMLKNKQAKVVKRCPFTIRLLYNTGNVMQPVVLGVDAGSKTIGLSATTEKKELYAAEITLRTDITNNLSTRREFRNARRHRKTRYRQPRFNNRVKSKHKGWLAPSVEAKINAHIQAVRSVSKILPIVHVTIEVASFDTQLIQAVNAGKAVPSGEDYQHGEQLGFWNVREYVLCRDGRKCACCHGKSKDPILNVHHIESRKTGGDAPNNLITLCETCHKGYHKGTINLPVSIKRGTSLRDAAFMNIMRWTVYNRLQDIYPRNVSITYGYITKNIRITCGLPKTHCVDARCISGNPCAEPLGHYYNQRRVRGRNRQLHKTTFLKGGIRKSNQAAKEVFGLRLFDKVMYLGQECFVFARRTRGTFNIRLLDGTKINTDVSRKRLKLLEHSNTILTEIKQS